MKNKLKTYEELLDRFTQWASSNKDIRLTFIIGSRARKTCSADEWSDLDLVIVTEDPDAILKRDDWLTNIDTPKIMFYEDIAVANSKERRILFDSGLDIDFIVFSGPVFKEAFKDSGFLSILKRGMQIIIDKDKLTADLKLPMEDFPSQSIPCPDEFTNLINNFWFHTVWAAKKLRRGEILQAKFACDDYMKHLLIQLIKWNVYCKRGRNYDTWHDYRFFERWVEPGVLAKMQNVYAHYEEEDIWKALFSTMDLFRELCCETASLLKYPYPIGVDEYATGYVDFLNQNRKVR